MASDASGNTNKQQQERGDYMGWGTSYKYDGYISRITVSQLYSQKEEKEDIIRMLQDDLIALATTTPPASGMINEDGEEGGNELWADYAIRKARNIFRELQEEQYVLFQIDQALEVKSEHPEDVVDS